MSSSLSEFLTEAVSRKRNSFNRPDKDGTVQDIVDWLESYGVKGVWWNESHDEDPPVKPGELVWFAGPCNKYRTETHWVSLMNNLSTIGTERSQEVCIYTKQRNGFLRTQDQEDVDLTFEQCLGLMAQMLDDPRKHITAK